MNNIINIANSNVYIVDFLNIFSDFREIKYKKNNIDFHSVKHCNKDQDTYDFFKLFFSKYINYVKIDKKSYFYFIMKKLNNYETILDNIIKSHPEFNTTFIIIEDKYENSIIDKNKDDFLCQYFFYILKQNNNNTILISNDKYRDKKNYIDLFVFDIPLSVITYNTKTSSLNKFKLKIGLNKYINKNINLQKFNRCTIPKKHLNHII